MQVKLSVNNLENIWVCFAFRVWELVGTSEGFVGCIHKFRVGRRPIVFSERDSFVSSVRQVYQCPVVSPAHRFTTTPMYSIYESDDEFFPELHSGGGISSSTYNNNHAKDPELPSFCSLRNPCHNHGHCWNDKGSSSGYRCVCHPEFNGKGP